MQTVHSYFLRLSRITKKQVCSLLIASESRILSYLNVKIRGVNVDANFTTFGLI